MSHSVRVKLRNKPNKDGFYTIILQLTIDRKTTELKIDHAIQLNQFNADRSKVIKHNRADFINKEITDSIKYIEDTIFEIKQRGEELTHTKISALYRNRYNNTNDSQGSNILFSDYLNNYISTNKDELKRNTITYYKTTLNQWRDLFPKLKLEDVKEKDILEFREHLKESGLKINTVYNRLKVVKKMLLMAKREGLIQTNPFQNITLQQEKGSREYLVTDEVRSLIELSGLTQIESEIRDVFIFGIYTGLRFSDICTLTEKNLVRPINNKYKYRIKLKIQKTEDIIEFHLNPVATALIDKYIERKETYIFPMLDKLLLNNYNEIKKLISSKNAYYNKVLKKLAKKANIIKPISFHCSRHTFAVLSIEKGADLYVLSKMMGHNSI
ncbi:MAG: site-specific integrase, partial [Romboutsia sp.]|nr:site-specific integrase [Romboutsia sp.]